MADECLDLTEILNLLILKTTLTTTIHHNEIVGLLESINTKVLDLELSLMALDEKVVKIQRSIGEFPAIQPSSVIKPCTGQGTGSSPKEIPSLLMMVEWFFERFDEVMGQFEVPVEIEDTDPEKPGSQKEVMCIPNIAEGLAELITINTLTYINTEYLRAICARNLVSTGSAAQEQAIAHKLLRSLTDYIGMNTKQKKISFPLAFNPEGTDDESFLAPKKVDLVTEEYEGKTLQQSLVPLLHAASVIRAVYTQEVDVNEDIPGQLTRHVLDLDKQRTFSRNNNQDDFTDELRKIEDGLIGETGIKDSDNPYGKSYLSRPKIRVLGVTVND